MPTLDQISITDDAVPSVDRALTLYNSVGWTNNTKDPERLRRALAGSLRLVSADAEPGQIAFYESLGFTELHDFPGDGLRGFARFPS